MRPFERGGILRTPRSMRPRNPTGGLREECLQLFPPFHSEVERRNAVQEFRHHTEEMTKEHVSVELTGPRI